MVEEIAFYENKNFITLVIVVAVSLALFAMFATTTVGQGWLRVLAKGIMP